MAKQKTKSRGFGSMDPERQREIASLGGQASGGKFEEDSQRTRAAHKGAAAEPLEARVKGGKQGHQHEEQEAA